MGYGFDYDVPYGIPQEGGAVAGVLIVLVLLLGLLVCCFGILSYVLQAVGMYTVGKRRGIHHSWLAWLPIGNMWLLGSISDQYQYVVKGKVKNRRKILLGLTIGIFALSVPANISYFAMLVTGLAEAPSNPSGFAVSVVFGALFGLALSVATIVAMVYQYIATYDLFVSCDPGNATLYLVLSILFPVTLPFFLFACRKKDLGMPPRKAPPSAAPAAPAAPAPVDDVPEAPAEATPEEDA